MDIVKQALAHAAGTGHTNVFWVITFVNNETRGGEIHDLANGNYTLTKGTMQYFFNADKVVYMYPRE